METPTEVRCPWCGELKHLGEAHPTPPPAALAPARPKLVERALRPTVYGVERPASGFDTILTLNRDEWRLDPHALLRLIEMFAQQLCARLPSVHDLEQIAAPPSVRAEAPEGAEAERWRLAGERVGIVYGCDTPDWMAETILGLRADVARLTQALEQAQRETANVLRNYEIIDANWRDCVAERDQQAGALGRLQEALDVALADAHYAKGVADLAMKHRDAAEAEVQRLRDFIGSREPIAADLCGRCGKDYGDHFGPMCHASSDTLYDRSKVFTYAALAASAPEGATEQTHE